MKKFLTITILISLVLSGVFADNSATNFTNKFKINALNINKETDTSLEMDLDIPSKITSFSISGVCKLSDNPRSLFRAVLVDKSGNEYLVAEYIGYLEENKNINFKNLCFETIQLDKIEAAKLKIILSQARVHVNSIEYSTDSDLSTKKAAKAAKKAQHKAFANKYNKHNQKHNLLWTADTLSNSANLSYMEKKQAFGGGSDYFMTDGFEYYSGGLFVVSESGNGLSANAPKASPKYIWSETCPLSCLSRRTRCQRL